MLGMTLQTKNRKRRIVWITIAVKLCKYPVFHEDQKWSKNSDKFSPEYAIFPIFRRNQWCKLIELTVCLLLLWSDCFILYLCSFVLTKCCQSLQEKYHPFIHATFIMRFTFNFRYWNENCLLVFIMYHTRIWFSVEFESLIDSMKRNGNVPTQFCRRWTLIYAVESPQIVFVFFFFDYFLSFVCGGAVNWNAG